MPGKLVSFALLLLLSTHPLHSMSIVNNAKRCNLISTFSGSISSGNTVLVYGTNGVIVRSDDWGSTWKSFSIPNTLATCVWLSFDASNISCLQSDGSVFSTPIASHDWKLQTKCTFSDIRAVTQDTQTKLIYILDGSKLHECDLAWTELRELTLPSEYCRGVVIDDTMIVLSEYKHLFTASTKSMELLDSIPLTSFVPDSLVYLTSPAQFYNNSLYVGANSRLYRSQNSVKSWEKVTDCDGVFCVVHDSVVSLSFGLVTLDYSFLSSHRAVRHGKEWIATDSLKDGSLDCYSIFHAALVNLRDSLLISVGQYNEIVVSRDYGKSWNWISYNGSNRSPVMYDSQRGFICDMKRVYQTTNACATWLPNPRHSSDSLVVWLEQGVCVYSDSSKVIQWCPSNTGIGVRNMSVHSLATQQTEYFENTDYKSARTLLPKCQRSDKYLLAFIPRTQGGHQVTMRCILDSTLSTVEKLSIDSLWIEDVRQLTPDRWIGYASYKNVVDTGTVMCISIDKGITWQRIDTLHSTGDVFYRSLVIGDLYYFVSYQIQATSTKSNGYKVGYYDWKSGVGDGAILEQNPITGTLYPWVEYDSTIICGASGFVYEHDLRIKNQNVWQIDSLFGDFRYSFLYKSDSNVLCGYSTRIKSTDYGNYNLAWIELSQSLATSVPQEVERVYTPYHLSDAYPNPTRSSVSVLYWSTIPPSENSRVALFNSIGEVVNAATMKATQIDATHTQFSWDCADLLNGVYFVHIDGDCGPRTAKVVVVQ